ncbi:MAG: DUF1853 family protein [Myxococcota bacterium]|nr:DUF1853 family protein [Myxococcota bacterium]
MARAPEIPEERPLRAPGGWRRWVQSAGYAALPAVLRDLFTLLFGPPLLSHSEAPPLLGEEMLWARYAETRSWALKLLQEAARGVPVPTPKEIARGGSQIGLYFERLLFWWLEGAGPYTLVAHNLQVHGLRAGRRETLGAFDFILRDRDGTALHWELAIKFYLERAASSRWESWVGPNERDRLDLKLGKIATQQLPLSSSPEGVIRLEEVGIHARPVQRALLRGLFFQRGLRAEGEAAPRPKGAHGACIGRWFHLRDLPALFAEVGPARWDFRHRPAWISSIATFDPVPVMGEQALIAEITARLSSKRAVMLSRLSPARESDGLWVEIERILIVKNGWGDDQR